MLLRHCAFLLLALPLALGACGKSYNKPVVKPTTSQSASLASQATPGLEQSDEDAPQLASLGSIEIERQKISCVPYARQISGIQLKGDAWRWWEAAQGVYKRGNKPEVGAIVVMSKKKGLERGHLAVVTAIVSDRILQIDHANWKHGEIHRGSFIMDVSKANDWSKVRVWYPPIADFGTGVYPISGFIYPELAGS